MCWTRITKYFMTTRGQHSLSGSFTHPCSKGEKYYGMPCSHTESSLCWSNRCGEDQPWTCPASPGLQQVALFSDCADLLLIWRFGLDKSSQSERGIVTQIRGEEEGGDDWSSHSMMSVVSVRRRLQVCVLSFILAQWVLYTLSAKKESSFMWNSVSVAQKQQLKVPFLIGWNMSSSQHKSLFSDELKLFCFFFQNSQFQTAKSRGILLSCYVGELAGEVLKLAPRHRPPHSELLKQSQSVKCCGSCCHGKVFVSVSS